MTTTLPKELVSGLGSLAGASTINGGDWSGADLAVADGGTGASDASGARTNLGLVIGSAVQAHSAVLDATTASFLVADETKLDGIAASATANDTDANLKARANHTGTQTLSTISDAGSVAALSEIDESDLSAAVQTKLNNTAPSKFDATAAPTANSDSANTDTNGTFAVGSVWIDVTNDEAYRCMDATATAAIWISTTLTSAELGSLAVKNNINNSDWSGTDLALVNGGTGASTAADARTNLGVVIGTDVQAHSAVLDATTASFLTADETKLDGVEAGAEANLNWVATAYTDPADFTAGTTTQLTLSSAAPSDDEDHVRPYFHGILQKQTEWSIAGTTITFTSAIPTGVTDVEIHVLA